MGAGRKREGLPVLGLFWRSTRSFQLWVDKKKKSFFCSLIRNIKVIMTYQNRIMEKNANTAIVSMSYMMYVFSAIGNISGSSITVKRTKIRHRYTRFPNHQFVTCV